jgi:hypothetical protein
MKKFDITLFLINLGITALFSLGGIGLVSAIATAIYRIFQYNTLLGIAGLVWWVSVVGIAAYFTMKEDK